MAPSTSPTARRTGSASFDNARALFTTVAQGFSPAGFAALKGCATGEESALRGGRSARQLAIEPALGERPLALHGGGRDAQGRCRLFDRQTREETQLDDASLIRVEQFELLQHRSRSIASTVSIEPGAASIRSVSGTRHAAAPTFVAAFVARVIHEDAAHQLRGNREEVAAVLPVDFVLAEQLQVPPR